MRAAAPERARLEAAAVRALFAGPVGVGLRHEEDGPAPRLFPEEESLLGPGAMAKRRRQFALGRAAAHEALRQLGQQPVPIGRGAGGEPLWPAGLVGSISHTAGVALAVVGRREDHRGLGVDLEARSSALSEAAARLVCRPSELAWVAAGRDDEDAALRRLLVFSAKEALYKALYPSGRMRLGFMDVELDWQPFPGGFVACLLSAGGTEFPRGSTYVVRCRVTPDLALSAVGV